MTKVPSVIRLGKMAMVLTIAITYVRNVGDIFQPKSGPVDSVPFEEPSRFALAGRYTAHVHDQHLAKEMRRQRELRKGLQDAILDLLLLHEAVTVAVDLGAQFLPRRDRPHGIHLELQFDAKIRAVRAVEFEAISLKAASKILLFVPHLRGGIPCLPLRVGEIMHSEGIAVESCKVADIG